MLHAVTMSHYRGECESKQVDIQRYDSDTLCWLECFACRKETTMLSTIIPRLGALLMGLMLIVASHVSLAASELPDLQ